MAERVGGMIARIVSRITTVAADQSSASLDTIHTLRHENLVAMASTAEGIESLRATAIALEQQVDRFNISSARLQPA